MSPVVPLSFSVPAEFLPRLAKLHLAADQDQSCAILPHIGVRVTPKAVRFTATNGKLLAMIVISDARSVLGPRIVPQDFVLDCEAFTVAMAGLVKAKAKWARFTIDPATPKQCQINCSLPSPIYVARLVDGVYPEVNACMAKPNDGNHVWVPATGATDQTYTAIAAKLAGIKGAMLFHSAVPRGRFPAAFDAPVAEPNGENPCPMDEIRYGMRQPSWWSDGELAILIMPVTRATGHGEPDLHAFAIAKPETAIV